MEPRIENRGSQFGLWSLLIGISVVAIIVAAVGWWQVQTPSAWEEWRNESFKPPDDSETTIPLSLRWIYG